ncbi:MAG TPA: amidohydrolase family protein [Candidatus Limnocylindria bacterium]|jgi:imidazolonepropionase-like amidohydrolase|nr:amidohydrolase family protein [Candidatus Limnocylindria bacterium]
MSTDRQTWLGVDRLLDGSGQAARMDVVVGLSGSTITWVGSKDELDEDRRRNVQWFAGCTLLPGLIDMHTHLSLAADGRSYEEMAASDDRTMVDIAARNALIHLQAGVTTVRENGARNNVGFTVRDAIAAGDFQGPRVLASGRPITPSRGHFHWCNGVADGEAGVRAAAKRLVAQGADHLKIMASGGGTKSSDPRLPSYSTAELAAAVDVAHQHERLTTAHCRATESLARARSARVDCVEHAEFLAPDGEIHFDRGIAESLVESGVYISPTLQAFGHYRLLELRRLALERGLTTEEQLDRDRLERHLEAHLRTFAALLELGAGPRVVYGSDAGPHVTRFGDVVFGLQLMVEGGMTRSQAIAAATGVAAGACGRTDIGAIAVGKRADCIIVRGDPSADIAALGRMVAVYKDGALMHATTQDFAAASRGSAPPR